VLVIGESACHRSEKQNSSEQALLDFYYPHSLQEAVIDTIVAKVQGVPGDDRCVLMLGYPDQMEKMMREANPGLARRFQLQDAWHFEDYSSEDLLHIMKGTAARGYDWQLEYPVLRAGVRVLDNERRKPNFGNAGAVNNLLAQVRVIRKAILGCIAPWKSLNSIVAYLWAWAAQAGGGLKAWLLIVGCLHVEQQAAGITKIFLLCRNGLAQQCSS
jgi:hypothetical protein